MDLLLHLSLKGGGNQMKTGIKNKQLIHKENRNTYIGICFIPFDFVAANSNDLRSVGKVEENHNMQI